MITNEEKYRLEYDRINDIVLELEDSIDRFDKLTNVYYDKKQHMLIVEQYNNALVEIKKSNIDTEDKKIFLEIIKTLFEKLLNNHLIRFNFE